MRYVTALTVALLFAMDPTLQAAEQANKPPNLEHIAVWVGNLEQTSAFLTDALGWSRSPLVFGVGKDWNEFGGMKLAFINANGLWLELVQPTTPGPGMDLLQSKGPGALVELDFHVADLNETIAGLRARGIEPVGMDGKPLRKGGLLTEWYLANGTRGSGDERLAYVPLDVSHGTSVELFWEYPSGVVLRRDAIWKRTGVEPSRTVPRLDHVVVLAADLEKTSKFYTSVLGLKRIRLTQGLPRAWMHSRMRHAWLKANDKNFWIELISPRTPSSGGKLLHALGDGAIVELDAEVPNINAFYDQMKQKGINMTAGDGTPLPAGKKSVLTPSGDRFCYFPRDKSAGMRIMIFQRGSASSIFSRRDEAATN